MRQSLYILTLSCILFQVGVYAQKKSAYGGEKGIYLLNVLHPANKQIPYKDAEGFLIERSEERKNNFSTVMRYSTPSNLAEFMSRINEAKSQLPYPTEVDQDVVLEAWRIFEQTKSWDSLHHHLAYNYIATGFGVLLLDASAKKDVRYTYKISAVDRSGKVIESMTTNSISFPEKMQYGRPVYIKQTTDGIAATLIWGAKGSRLPHHFKVYRSSSETGSFVEYALSKNVFQKRDTVYYAFTDNNMDKGNMYRYFIAPSDNYGNYNLISDTSISTNLLGKDAGLPARLNATAVDSINAVRLSWKVDAPYELDAIEIYRGIEYEAPFVHMVSLSPNDTVYMDASVAPGQRYYYTLRVIDRLGRSSIYTNKVFALCNGSTSPLAPIKVFAEATEKGVKVNWIPNGESIRGFYVYRCEGIDGEFSQITDFIPFEENNPMFTYTDSDSSLQLGTTYSYCVRQENNGHLLGVAGLPALVQPIHSKQKTQLPLVQLSASSIDKGVLLSWNMKISLSGLKGINILRKSNSDKNFVVINKQLLDNAVQSFSDTTAIKENDEYQYYLSFVGMSGAELQKTNLVKVTKENTALASPYNLQGEIDGTKLVLTWETASTRVKEFKIYSRIPGEEPKFLANVNASTSTYSCPLEYADSVKFYFVVAVNGKIESKPSNEWKLIKITE